MKKKIQRPETPVTPPGSAPVQPVASTLQSKPWRPLTQRIGSALSRAMAALDISKPRLRRFLQKNFPLLTSLAVHAAILLLGFATYTVGTVVVPRVQEQIIVPDAMIIEGAEIGGLLNPGIGGDPTRPAASDDVPENFVGDGWVAGRNLGGELRGLILGGSGDMDASALGVGIGLGGDRAGGAGPGLYGGEAGGAPFGVPGGGGGMGVRSTFMGISGNARRIVYICDASGSMIDRFSLLMTELNRSAGALKPVQSFTVIFFGHIPPSSLSNELLAANTTNKGRLEEFLDNMGIGRGGSDPVPSLRLAFAAKPEVIYLLTDGAFTPPRNEPMEPGITANERVVRELRRLNRDKRVRINTIAFVSGNPDLEGEEDYVLTLQTIAREHGGTFRMVSARDLRDALRDP